MSGRFWAGAAVLAAALVGTVASAAAAQDPWLAADVDIDVSAIVREVHHAVRDGLRDVQRDLRHVTRDVSREVGRALRDLPEIHARYEVHGGQSAAEARREARDRAREQRNQARDRQREVRDRERSERAFQEISPTGDPCARRGRSGRNDRGHACQVRDARLGSIAGPLTVDAAPNGGIRVAAWDQSDVLVRAVIQTWAETDGEARDLADRVQVNAAGTSVSANGPSRDDRRDRQGWSVSYEIWAPRALALDLKTVNGGISLHGMHGDSQFTTRNGGVALEDVGGRISGRTQNGGVNVRLEGSRWDGAGLDVETTNGGVTLAVPRDYSASLDLSTVNGGFRTDLPMTVQGRLDRQVKATLGSGGAPVTIRTTNGGVRVYTR